MKIGNSENHRSYLSAGLGIILLSSIMHHSKEKIVDEKHHLLDEMIERRKNKNKDMKATMEEFWKELKETRK